MHFLDKMNKYEIANLKGMKRYCKEAEIKFIEYFEGLIIHGTNDKGNYSENTKGNLVGAIDAMKQIIRSSKNRLEKLTQTQSDKTEGEEK